MHCSTCQLRIRGMKGNLIWKSVTKRAEGGAMSLWVFVFCFSVCFFLSFHIMWIQVHFWFWLLCSFLQRVQINDWLSLRKKLSPFSIWLTNRFSHSSRHSLILFHFCFVPIILISRYLFVTLRTRFWSSTWWRRFSWRERKILLRRKIFLERKIFLKRKTLRKRNLWFQSSNSRGKRFPSHGLFDWEGKWVLQMVSFRILNIQPNICFFLDFVNFCVSYFALLPLLRLLDTLEDKILSVFLVNRWNLYSNISEFLNIFYFCPTLQCITVHLTKRQL